MFRLNQAWSLREQLGCFKENEAVRVFHGPGEGDPKTAERFFAIDKFGDHYWVTQWESKTEAFGSVRSEQSGRPRLSENLTEQLTKTHKKIIEFLKTKNAISIYGLKRPTQDKVSEGLPKESEIFFSQSYTSIQNRIEIHEGPLRFLIQLQKTRHPGLFLDQEPLRKWLIQSMKGLKVLNTFAYTGSLSVAAAYGGAKEVVTLDLSQPTLQWAKENMNLNKIDPARLRFIHGDVFEWLPRLKKNEEKFDCIILDPPSFSRGKKSLFSTQKDLIKLHSLALELLSEGGFLVSSINSANVSWNKYQMDVIAAAQKQKIDLQVIRQITLPETFPTRLEEEPSRYLKGWIFRF